MDNKSLQKPRVRVKFMGMEDCVHRGAVTWEDYDCPCGTVYTMAYIECPLKGRIRALQCRMSCDKYAQEPRTTTTGKD